MSVDAEVIAQALRERGVDATVVPTPQLPLNPTQAARVLVLESDLDDARRAGCFGRARPRGLIRGLAGY